MSWVRLQYHFTHLKHFLCIWSMLKTPTLHDDVIKWKHFPRYWPFVRGIHRSPVNSPHKGQWRGALIFSLICLWINGWVNTDLAWWRHQMEAFSALLAICAGNSPVPGEFPAQRPVTRSFDIFFDLPLNKRLSKQSWGWWFETLSRSLWRHCRGLRHRK